MKIPFFSLHKFHYLAKKKFNENCTIYENNIISVKVAKVVSRVCNMYGSFLFLHLNKQN